jgi:hypothetical protein
MNTEAVIFLKVTPHQFLELDKALRMLAAQRKASRKAAQRRAELQGRTYVENGHKIEPFTLHVMTHADLFLEYEKMNSIVHN